MSNSSHEVEMLRMTLIVGAALVLSAAGGAHGAESFTLTLGAGEEGRAELVFRSPMTPDDVFVVRTERVGAPGSVIASSVDGARSNLVEHTLRAEDCKFGDGEGAKCEFSIGRGTQAYADLVAAFKAGLTAHLEVTHAGSAAMRSDVSLRGFSRAFEKL